MPVRQYKYISSLHSQLSINLAIAASFSITFAHHIVSIPIYPYLANDYPAVLSLLTHHMWIGGILSIGAGAHASIASIRDPIIFDARVNSIQTHRDIILGHLIWLSISLGLHAFSLYIHNDTLQAFGRPEDIFADNSIQLKPVFATLVQTSALVSFDIKILDLKVIRITQELGTADFLVHHIHAFTIHLTVLVLLKGILYARNSSLVADKEELGFRYPCDGPGRGGSCQISPWDHIYLAVFWMVNSISVVLFHFFWKMQSDVWGAYNISSHLIQHISSSDFSIHSTTIRYSILWQIIFWLWLNLHWFSFYLGIQLNVFIQRSWLLARID